MVDDELTPSFPGPSFRAYPLIVAGGYARDDGLERQPQVYQDGDHAAHPARVHDVLVESRLRIEIFSRGTVALCFAQNVEMKVVILSLHCGVESFFKYVCSMNVECIFAQMM